MHIYNIHSLLYIHMSLLLMETKGNSVGLSWLGCHEAFQVGACTVCNPNAESHNCSSETSTFQGTVKEAAAHAGVASIPLIMRGGRIYKYTNFVSSSAIWTSANNKQHPTRHTCCSESAVAARLHHDLSTPAALRLHTKYTTPAYIQVGASKNETNTNNGRAQDRSHTFFAQ